MALTCKWCGCELNSWYYRYRGEVFCQDNRGSCLKNYLFEEADKEIEEDRVYSDDYSMDMVLFMEERGFE